MSLISLKWFGLSQDFPNFPNTNRDREYKDGYGREVKEDTEGKVKRDRGGCFFSTSSHMLGA